jgi:flagellar biogenesis protein FliO
LVEVNDQKILVGATDQTLTNLYQLQNASSTNTAISEKTTNNFSEILDQVNSTIDQSNNK